MPTMSPAAQRAVIDIQIKLSSAKLQGGLRTDKAAQIVRERIEALDAQDRAVALDYFERSVASKQGTPYFESVYGIAGEKLLGMVRVNASPGRVSAAMAYHQALRSSDRPPEADSSSVALAKLGYTTEEAARMQRYAPSFAAVVAEQSSEAKSYYRGLMVVPALYRFDRALVDITPGLQTAQRYSGGGLFEERHRGQYANLVMEYKLPPGLVRQGAFAEASHVKVPWLDERAAISRVGVLLQEPGRTALESQLVFLPYEEAFHTDGPAADTLKSVEELKALARARRT